METAPIQLTDVAIAGVLVVSGVFALIRGVVREVLSIVGWVGAAAATYYGLGYIQPRAHEVISSPLLADLAAMGVLFVGTLIAATLISGAISRRVKKSQLGPLDRSLGFLFGLARGGALVSIGYVMVIWATLPDDPPAWLREARASPLVAEGAAIVCLAVPAKERAEENSACAKVEDAIAGTFDPRQAFDELTGPPPTVDDVGPDGYNRVERKGMDRLIQSTE